MESIDWRWVFSVVSKEEKLEFDSGNRSDELCLGELGFVRV